MVHGDSHLDEVGYTVFQFLVDMAILHIQLRYFPIGIGEFVRQEAHYQLGHLHRFSHEYGQSVDIAVFRVNAQGFVS